MLFNLMQMEKDYRNHSQEELLIKIRELEKEVKKLNHQIIKDDRYGLNWIDCPEAFEEESENKIPILEEAKDKAITNNDGKPTHILIEGDNYHALTCLNYTHKGKIDVIYIDPPYNTGSDGFTYKDKRFLKEYPNGQQVPKEHPLRHSYWLSFMNKRLKLAKELLSDDGVIFISIDDNEVAQLKLLCDKIFFEDNLLGIVTVAKGTTTGQDAKKFGSSIDYLLAYANSKFEMGKSELSENDKKRFSRVDEKGNYSILQFRKTGNNDRRENRPNLFYPLIAPDGSNIYPYGPGGYESTWRGDLKFYNKLNKSKMIEWIKQEDQWKPYVKYYLEGRGKTPSNLWTDIEGNKKATIELKDIFSNKIFLNPKPTDLICKVLEISNNQSSIILDFFAGSGTTMHATMNLNEKDNGNRQCILVQQNENNICEEVCYERNKRVIQGYTNPKGEDIDGLGNSLKYYKTSFVGKHSPKKATDDDRVELSHKAGYLLALSENTLEEIMKTDYYQIFENNDNATAIYFKEDLRGFDDFVKEVENLEKPTSVYIFSWDNAQGFEYNFEHIKQVQIKSIPQAILEIYKSINQ